MKTIIVSAFPGCGKTFLCNIFNDEQMCIDKDNGDLTTEQQFKQYAQEIIDLVGRTKFLLISQYPEVLNILHKKGYKYIIVAPNNSSLISNTARRLIKQQWFGRFLLRGNQTVWLSKLLQNYDNWTSLEHLTSMSPSKIVLLNQYEYLTSIIEDLKEMSKFISN